ncbi:hypothetical protein B0H63DRAFT_466570 [Podospora didyma]|uniref:3-hydroxyacyl-CoA dehydrogenase n=1 Tax=Podospora didyma TaxID=330526 RepID=A0AAE0U4N6_9PEZI|nr:hypothetical protein B0H63DRAFT_466570 [Podospora didyma]
MAALQTASTSAILHSAMASKYPLALGLTRGLTSLRRIESSKIARAICTAGTQVAPSRLPQLGALELRALILRNRHAIPSTRQFSTSHASQFYAINTGKAPIVPTWRTPTEEDMDERPVLIIGAGTMGRRLACVWASASRPVTLYDTSQDALKSAAEYLADNLGAYCAVRGTHPGHVCMTSDLRVATTTGRFEGLKEENEARDVEIHSGAKGPWMAIDCLPESLELKIAVLSHMEHLLPRNCIIASNSSSLQTSEMVSSMDHPERLLNTHYYIPPRNRMVELMSSSRTHREIFPFLAAQMKRVGFKPMIVPPGVQSQGLIFNRIWGALKREVLAVASEGVAKPADIDALFRDFFHAEKGPCERMDEIGLDTVANYEAHCLEQRPELGSQPSLDWLERYYIGQGRLGEKSGDGLYSQTERDELKEMHRLEHYKVVEEATGA